MAGSAAAILIGPPLLPAFKRRIHRQMERDSSLAGRDPVVQSSTGTLGITFKPILQTFGAWPRLPRSTSKLPNLIVFLFRALPSTPGLMIKSIAE